MRKFVFFLLGIGLLPRAVNAQKIALEDALKMALENRLELKNQQLQLRIAEGEEAKLRAKWLPQVNASADMRWNTQLQTSVFKNAPFANGQDVKLVLGVPFNNNVGLSAEQKVYDAATKYDRLINSETVEGQKITLEKQKIDIKQAVTEGYYAVLFSQEKITLAEKAVVRAQAYWESGKTKWEKGTILKNDFDRLQLDVNNAQTALTKAKQDLKVNQAYLLYQIGLKQTSVELTETLEKVLTTSENTIPETSLDTRPELKQEQSALRLNELLQQKQKSRLAPLVSAYGNYTALQLNDKFNPFSSGTWFPFNYVGLKLNIPLYDGKQTAFLRNEYALKTQVNRNTMEKLKGDFEYEITNTTTVLAQEKANVLDTKKNVALAQQILETDRIRYEKGTLLLADLKNTEYSLQNAETNYLNSVYQFLIALVRYKKAAGTL
jgi:outer membrane protein